jgi:hypothetical protein
MTQTELPRVARWMLEHCTPPGRDEALAGDLLEEFRAGRTAQWYWRQVLSAIAIGWMRDIRNHRALFVFALLWSALVPGWLVIIASFEQHFSLNKRFVGMVWPWSTACDLGFLLAANLIFIWVGIGTFLFLHFSTARSGKIHLLSRGVIKSLPVLMTLWAALILLPKFFLESRAFDQFSATPIGSSAITSLNPLEVTRILPQATWEARYGLKPPDRTNAEFEAIADTRKSAILARLPFFLVVLCALWKTDPSEVERHKRIFP